MAARGFRNVIQAAALYIEGSSYAGEAEQVKLPVVQSKMEEHRPMGLPSEVKRFTGYEPMEFTATINAFDPEVLGQVGSPDVREKDYMVRFSTQSNDGEVKYGVAEISGRASTVDVGDISNGEEIAATELTVEVVSYKLTFDSQIIYDIDTEEGKYIILGTDYWEPIQAGL